MSSPTDSDWMGVALSLAARGLGRVWPNPSVGCVLVSPDGRVVGRGWTQPGGRPHAEREALDRAGSLARGATAFVTLEPCSHHGKTPPCADALIEAGVSRVVVALADPDERVSGRGIARLREAGIRVRTGVREAEARDLNLGFLLNRVEQRPLVTLKAATSLDGKIATASGHSQWITRTAAREVGHRLRATHDAIAVGLGTVLADDPTLTCRLPGLEDRSPVRVVFDSRARLPLDGALIRAADRVPLWVVTGPEAPEDRRAELEARGARVLFVAGDAAGRPLLDAALASLARQGITRLLVEGGGDLASAFLRARLVDRLAWFRAPIVIGGDGKAAITAFGVDRLEDSAQFSARARFEAGSDLVEYYEAPDPSPPSTFPIRRRSSQPMFTGIVTDLGGVKEIVKDGDTRFTFTTSYDMDGVALGASIACCGVCLTVVDTGPNWFAVQASAETLSKTTLGNWAVGTPVNFERAMALGDELGGHIVSGHVDGVAEVLDITPEGESHRVRFRVPEHLKKYIASKGSVAIDGVSLTVNEVEGDVFGVNIIPHTFEVTTFGSMKPGSKVNLEIDMLARYVARLLNPDA